MSKIGRCCCGDCCITDEEMPYGEVQLRSPVDPCGYGGTIPENPTYPTSTFTRSGCCFEARFVFQCMPVTFNCSLWAKRNIDISFTSTQYGVLNIFADPGDNPEDFTCDPIAIQQSSVVFHGVARVFLLQSIQLNAVTIRVGKMLTQCDGDLVPVCRYFISSTYEYYVNEGASQIQSYVNKSIACSGLYDDPNCSVTESYVIEEGTDSDTCPFESCENCTEFDIFEVTRLRFFDVLPDVDIDVSIFPTDDGTFDCCDGKVNCVIVEESCGLVIGSNCLDAVPTYDEFMNIQGALIPECTSQLPRLLSYNYGTETWECATVVEVVEPQVAFANIFYQDGACWFLEATCETLTVGEDELQVQLYDENGDPLSMQTIDVCGILGQRIPSGGSTPGTPFNFVDCFGGQDPPLPGLCTNDKDCCEIVGNQIITNPCSEIAQFAGGKLTDFQCDHTRTNYTVGATCISIPTTTVRFAS